jgi:hypothetical protein
MMGAINGDKNLQSDLNAYAKAKMNGDDTLFDKYVDGAYDSSADFWRLKAVMDANGNVTNYTVDWDDSLDLNIENADGTITEVAANAIQAEAGIDSINQWFRQNGLAFSDDIKQGFVSLGIASEAATALTDAINNENSAKNFDTISKDFTNSITALINSGLNIGGLGTEPDQSKMYGLMPDSTLITTLYGIRLVTPELKKGNVTGTLYNWAKYEHYAEDIAGGKIVQTPTTTKSLDMAWSDLTGFKVTIGFDNGYTFENNHLSSDSTMNLLQSMLLSESTKEIMAGLRFATVGTTGAASTGPHNHLVGKKQSVEMKPTDIFKAMGIPNNYQKQDTELTGFPDKTAYNDPLVLQDILKYGKEFDRQAYVNAHAELFQPYTKNTPNGLVKYIFDISTMSYKTHSHR